MTKTLDRPGARQPHEEAGVAESRAILRRVRQETEPQVGAGTMGMLGGIAGHFAARDADPADRIEVVGMRIGRLLGFVAFLALAVLLASQLLYD
ncbi:hypothetical protein ASG43_15135 [Aureimonas sp. Leaf454]|uniref:hypothetical protein n=1 Tax=Aureimonas sp. Leaf454 TaxID=1736381 RepID=UPI0006FF7BFC|nr:hypothetical protein [Aureimonas sp. Leaf454]KQT42893.1 hypothetical protein ASG43_15135 [Aureimonas sp. Leaf454]